MYNVYMDPNAPRKYSFPNVDQNIPGVSGSDRPEDDSQIIKPKRVINIMEALSTESKDNEGEAQTIKTYQGDIASAIKNDNVSMIKIALAEKRRQDTRGGGGSLDGTLNSSSNNNKYLIVFGIMAVFIVGGLLAGYLFLQSQSSQKQAVVQNTVQPILYTEEISNINIDGKDLNQVLKAIDQEKNGVMDTGTMKAIYLTSGVGTSTQSLTTQDFFSILQTRVPDGLIRVLDPNFLFGVYAYTPREMFAIFKVSSYDTAFANMLQWEPNIETDIGSIFMNKNGNNPVNTTTESMNISSTTSSSSIPLQQNSPLPSAIFTQKKFVDKVFSNKDVRVLQDPQGQQYMFYSFIDKETLVIATSEKTLKEILFRITTGRIVR
jgi:hypothetical protein